MNRPESEQESQSQEALLTPVEARILGALMEKQRTTPDNYPLTLNSLVQACNQKTSRSPVMNLQPGEVGHAVNLLRERRLIAAGFGGRAERFDQKLAKHLELDAREQAVICVLMLRGPQTLGELRSHTGRMANFEDLASVKETLELLMLREPPLVKRIPAAGRREERYLHLLCGDVELEQEMPEPAAAPLSAGGEDRIEALEEEVASLRRELESLWQLTGLESQRPDPEG